MMASLIFGIFVAALLFIILHWWANAEQGTAKNAVLWLIVPLIVLVAILLLMRGQIVTAIGLLTLAGWFLFGNKAKNPFENDGGSSSMTRSEALAILGLEEGATIDDIKAAYRRLMAKAHPDVGGTGWMASKLNQAKKLLLDE